MIIFKISFQCVKKNTIKEIWSKMIVFFLIMHHFAILNVIINTFVISLYSVFLNIYVFPCIKLDFTDAHKLLDISNYSENLLL